MLAYIPAPWILWDIHDINIVVFSSFWHFANPNPQPTPQKRPCQGSRATTRGTTLMLAGWWFQHIIKMLYYIILLYIYMSCDHHPK